MRAEQDGKLPAGKREALAKAYDSRAEELIREAAKLDVDDPVVQKSLAWFLVTAPKCRRGDAGRAVQLAEKAAKHAPRDAKALITLGAAHYRAGNWQAAVREPDKASGILGGGDPAGSLFWAMVKWQLGEKEKARQALAAVDRWMSVNKEEVDDTLRRLRAETSAVLKGEGSPGRQEKKAPPPKD